MVLVRWKKRGCVSSSRDIDRLNKAFQATKYVQNSGSIYLFTRSAPRYSAKAWVSFLATYKRPLPAEKAVKAFQGFSPLFSGRIHYSGWRLVECRSQTRKLVLSSLRAGWNNGTAAGLKHLYMNVVFFIVIVVTFYIEWLCSTININIDISITFPDCSCTNGTRRYLFCRKEAN